MSTSIAFAHDTFSGLRRLLLEDLAFADYLSPTCFAIFMFPNIPCGTLSNSACFHPSRPVSLCAMFDDDRSPLHVLHFWSFHIALNDKCSPRVVLISVRLFMLNKHVRNDYDSRRAFVVHSDTKRPKVKNMEWRPVIIKHRTQRRRTSRIAIRPAQDVWKHE